MPLIPHAYAEIVEIRDSEETSFVDMRDGTCFRVPVKVAHELCLHDRVLIDLSDSESYGRAHVVVLRADRAVHSFGALQVVSRFNLGKGNGLTMGADSASRTNQSEYVG